MDMQQPDVKSTNDDRAMRYMSKQQPRESSASLFEPKRREVDANTNQ